MTVRRSPMEIPGPYCPRCGSASTIPLTTQSPRYEYYCRHCKRRFGPTGGVSRYHPRPNRSLLDHPDGPLGLVLILILFSYATFWVILAEGR